MIDRLDFFQMREITGQAAGEALRVLAAIAQAVSDPAAIKELADLVEVALAEQSKAETAKQQAAQERSAADRSLAELEAADRNHRLHLEATNAEIARQRQDIIENTALLDQRHANLESRETELARRVAEHERAVAALQAHLGSRAA